MIYAIILAAGMGLPSNPTIPKCLLKVGEKTILERQLEILKWSGVNESNIIIIIGSEGQCWNKETINYIKKISARTHAKNVIFNNRNMSTGSNYSLLLALNKLDLKDEDTVLVIDGDVVFGKELTYKLLNYPYKNVLISRISYSATSHGGKIIAKDNRVVMAGSDIKIITLPYYIYGGVAKISGRVIGSLKKELVNIPEKHIIDAISKLLEKNEIHNLDIESINKEEEPTFLIGGSGAKLSRLLIVRKETRGEGVAKLSNEIKWLLSLPEDVQRYFPKVVGYNVTKSYAYLDTLYYSYPSLRRVLFTGAIGAEKAIEILLNLLDFMFKYLYSRIYRDGDLDWLYKLHFERVSSRWNETIRRAPIFRRVFNANRIVLNGEELVNAPLLIQSIKSRPELLKMLAPKIITMVHGDLHFQNILVNLSDNNKYNFILMDPRGELNGSDPIYDMGKLWHSFHGLYDFMHEDLFSLEIVFESDKTIQATLEIKNMSSLSEYIKIYERFPKLLEHFNPLNKVYDNWKMRTLFTEAMHFCTLMPFHLKGDGKEERAIAMYLTGVKILNEFYRDYKIESYKEQLKWINVNTLEDYLRIKSHLLRD